MQKIYQCMVMVALLVACGQNKSTQQQNKNTGAEVPPFKPVNLENIQGKWKVIDQAGVLTNKKLLGKTIEFVKDSMFWYDKEGNPLHSAFHIHKTYGPQLDKVSKSENGSTVTVTETVRMNFHEMEPDKLMFTMNGETIPMQQQK